VSLLAMRDKLTYVTRSGNQQTRSRLRWQHGLGDGTRQARSYQALQPGQPFAQELDLRKQVRPPVFFEIRCCVLCCPSLDS
jgi:hypothetical protein